MHSICYGRSILPNRCWLLSPLFRLQSCTPAKSFYFEYSAAAKATRKLLNCSHSTMPRRFHDDWRCLCPDRPAMQVYNALLVVVGWPFLLGGVLALIWVGIDLPVEGFIPGLYLLAAASITGTYLAVRCDQTHQGACSLEWLLQICAAEVGAVNDSAWARFHRPVFPGDKHMYLAVA